MISPAPTARRPFQRMQHIHEGLRAGRPVNASIVGRELETSPRTIQRDLDFMRDSLGLPIEYESDLRTFVYTWPVDPAIFGPVPAPARQEPRGDAFGLPLDKEPAAHLAVVCERHGLRPADVLRAIVGETLADAVCNSTIMAGIVRAARVLATDGREIA